MDQVDSLSQAEAEQEEAMRSGEISRNEEAGSRNGKMSRESRELGLSPDAVQSGAVELLEAPQTLSLGWVFGSQDIDFMEIFLPHQPL